jgi:hypothetical protein
MSATELVVWGSVLHLVVDWLFQNRWIAENKYRSGHPSGYLHAVLQGLAMLIVFPPVAALALAVAHFVIDTRKPLEWWARLVDQPESGPVAVSVHIWRDQALHIATIAVAALIVAS